MMMAPSTRTGFAHGAASETISWNSCNITAKDAPEIDQLYASLATNLAFDVQTGKALTIFMSVRGYPA